MYRSSWFVPNRSARVFVEQVGEPLAFRSSLGLHQTGLPQSRWEMNLASYGSDVFVSYLSYLG